MAAPKMRLPRDRSHDAARFCRCSPLPILGRLVWCVAPPSWHGTGSRRVALLGRSTLRLRFLLPSLRALLLGSPSRFGLLASAPPLPRRASSPRSPAADAQPLPALALPFPPASSPGPPCPALRARRPVVFLRLPAERAPRPRRAFWPRPPAGAVLPATARARAESRRSCRKSARSLARRRASRWRRGGRSASRHIAVWRRPTAPDRRATPPRPAKREPRCRWIGKTRSSRPSAPSRATNNANSNLQ